MKTKKLMAAILSFSLILGLVPANIYADEMNNQSVSIEEMSEVADIDTIEIENDSNESVEEIEETIEPEEISEIEDDFIVNSEKEIYENNEMEEISEDSISENEANAEDESAVSGINDISNPRIVSDSSMTAKQKVTYDCIWLGSYPQAEVVASKSSYTAIGADYLEEGDIIENAALYSRLQRASYSSNNETTINGIRYKRMLKGDATYTKNHDSYYNWSDSTTYHYFKYEPIKWRVIEKGTSTAFLLADKGLDDQRYNNKETDITWKDCTLRNFLNTTFYDNAFNTSEKAMIRQDKVENADNLYYGMDGGEDTYDKVFLLSEKEVYKTYGKSFSDSSAAVHGFVDSNSTDDEARRARATTYSRAMGSGWDTIRNGDSNWWLRSPGRSSSNAAEVNCHGFVYCFGHDVVSSNNTARPALKINLSSLTDSMYAGTVCSDGQVDETARPEVTIVDVTKITLNKNSVELTEGETYTLSANVLPTDATDKSVTYTSANTSVATVNAEGQITAATEGSTKITVKSVSNPEVSAECIVTVTKPVPTTVAVTGITLNKNSVELKEEETCTLTATVAPADATDKSVTYESANTSVATVTTSGMITAVGAGSTTIIVKSVSNPTVTAVCTVTVKKPITVSSTGRAGATATYSVTKQSDGRYKITISGSGAMDKYEDSEDTPWWQYLESVVPEAFGEVDMTEYISEIEIGDNITRVTENAFDCIYAEKLTLPITTLCASNSFSTYCFSTVKLTPGTNGMGIDYADESYYSDYDMPWTKMDIDSKNVKLIISEGIKRIGNHMFDGMMSDNIDIGVLPSSLVEIGDYAFNRSNIISGDLDLSNCKFIGTYAFAGNDNIISIKLPKNTNYTGVAAGAFTNCDGLTTVSIPGNVKKIGISAFEGCDKLKYIAVSEGVEIIDTYAFVDCDAIGDVNLPASVVSIGADAFNGSTGKSEITINNKACAISDSYTTLRLFKTIRGYKDSTAINYAKNNDYDYEIIDGGSSPVDPEPTDPTEPDPTVPGEVDNPMVDENGKYSKKEIIIVGGKEVTVNYTVHSCYNGKKIMPTVELTIDGAKLTPNVDYKVSFKNNKDANMSYNSINKSFVVDSSKKTPTINIAFKGNYKIYKKASLNFNIYPTNLEKITVSIVPSKIINLIKNGKKFKYLKSINRLQEGKIKKLNAKKDMSECVMVSETGEIFDAVSNFVAKPGKYTIRVTGKGNYYGTITGGEFELQRK